MRMTFGLTMLGHYFSLDLGKVEEDEEEQDGPPIHSDPPLREYAPADIEQVGFRSI